MFWKAGQRRDLQERDDLLKVLRLGVREGVLDIEIAKKRLKRRGPPISLLPPVRGRGLTMETGLWEAVDRFAPKAGMRNTRGVVRQMTKEVTDASVNR